MAQEFEENIYTDLPLGCTDQYIPDISSSSSSSIADWSSNPASVPNMDLSFDDELLYANFDTSFYPPPTASTTSANPFYPTPFSPTTPIAAPTPSSTASSGPSVNSSISHQASHNHNQQVSPSAQQQDGSYQCTEPSCKCGGKTFVRPSELKKHVDRAKRPYPCTECAGTRPFATRHDLARHRKEVHGEGSGLEGAESLVCPLVTCKRHRKAFTRRENLKSHVGRVHGPEYLRGLQGPAAGCAREKRRRLTLEGGELGTVKDKLESLLRERDQVQQHLGRIDDEVKALSMTIQVMER